jgi:high-affinity Fe2+/Pb2+ permease
MAFLAVIREGFETAVFLVAVFNDAATPRRGPRRAARHRVRW